MQLAPAQRAVQACHAAIEATKHFPPTTQHPNVVLLGSTAIEAVHEQLQLSGLPLVVFREPDLNDQLTAIASGPLFGRERRHFRHLKLLEK